MNNQLLAWLRFAVASSIGAAVMAFLSSFKMLDAETIAAASSAIQLLVTVICYVAITSAAIKFPIINRILSLFLSANGPTYQEPPQAMSNKNTWGILIFGILLAASSHTSAQCCDGPESQCDPLRESVLGFDRSFTGFGLADNAKSVLNRTKEIVVDKPICRAQTIRDNTVTVTAKRPRVIVVRQSGQFIARIPAR